MKLGQKILLVCFMFINATQLLVAEYPYKIAEQLKGPPEISTERGISYRRSERSEQLTIYSLEEKLSNQVTKEALLRTDHGLIKQDCENIVELAKLKLFMILSTALGSYVEHGDDLSNVPSFTKENLNKLVEDLAKAGIADYKTPTSISAQTVLDCVEKIFTTLASSKIASQEKNILAIFGMNTGDLKKQVGTKATEMFKQTMAKPKQDIYDSPEISGLRAVTQAIKDALVKIRSSFLDKKAISVGTFKNQIADFITKLSEAKIPKESMKAFSGKIIDCLYSAFEGKAPSAGTIVSGETIRKWARDLGAASHDPLDDATIIPFQVLILELGTKSSVVGDDQETEMASKFIELLATPLDKINEAIDPLIAGIKKVAVTSTAIPITEGTTETKTLDQINAEIKILDAEIEADENKKVSHKYTAIRPQLQDLYEKHDRLYQQQRELFKDLEPARIAIEKLDRDYWRDYTEMSALKEGAAKEAKKKMLSESRETYYKQVRAFEEQKNSHRDATRSAEINTEIAQVEEQRRLLQYSPATETLRAEFNEIDKRLAENQQLQRNLKEIATPYNIYAFFNTNTQKVFGRSPIELVEVMKTKFDSLKEAYEKQLKQEHAEAPAGERTLEDIFTVDNINLIFTIETKSPLAAEPARARGPKSRHARVTESRHARTEAGSLPEGAREGAFETKSPLARALETLKEKLSQLRQALSNIAKVPIKVPIKAPTKSPDPEAAKMFIGYALMFGDNLKPFKTTLLQNPDIINTQDEKGETALHMVLYGGRGNDANNAQAALKFLCEQPGIDLNPKDKAGNTPLLKAVKIARDMSTYGESRALEWAKSVLILVQAGADPSIANNAGESPHSIAKTIVNQNVRTVIDKALKK